MYKYPQSLYNELHIFINTGNYCTLEFTNLPEAATSATGFCCSWAMKPTTEKITTPLNILVPEFTVQTIKASLLKN